MYILPQSKNKNTFRFNDKEKKKEGEGGETRELQGAVRVPAEAGPWVGRKAGPRGTGSPAEAVGRRHQPPGPDDGSPTEVLLVFAKADLPWELPRGRFHAAHDPAGCLPARLQATVCKTQVTHQGAQGAGP